MSNRFSKVKVQKANRGLYAVLCCGVRAFCALSGIRSSFENRCGSLPEGPAVVLCNHGSFLDFAYAGTVLRKCRPHFVTARLYFYHKWLSRLLQALGCFPKSMFAMDVESTKNCLRVLEQGEMLVMMPEARLSTAGSFEDIQEGTFSFLKKVGVPVYTMKICGDYFADPKWGKGLRRGSRVETTLEQLFTPDDLKALTPRQIREAVEARLAYDEFAWLETKPRLRYRSARLAEGLENILAVCPLCGGRHTILTKGREVSCEHCGRLTALDDRYAFEGSFRFANFAQWYRWQKEVLREEIAGNPDFCLRTQAELRLPSEDGRSLTRHGGEGVCTLNREGLTYTGTRDGEPCEVRFPLKQIYRLLFGAGENFEIYNGSEILYFVPEERRSAVDWYLTSMILYDEACGVQSTREKAAAGC